MTKETLSEEGLTYEEVMKNTAISEETKKRATELKNDK